MQTINRIAVNTILQYSRLIINLFVSLYSVRLILNALGASDYGIYDVVGGVIAIVGFINASLSQTSVRYLSVTMGHDDVNEVRNTFNTSFWLHIIISIAIFIILELIGPFIVNGFLNIPENRLSAARVVYQCTAMIMFLNIAITPFTALVVAHEDFLFTSIAAIIFSILKLGIAFILLVSTKDKLILYGVLMGVLTCVNVLFYISYVAIKYRTEFFVSKPQWNKIKKQSSFAGWTLMDVLGNVATRQGYSIMLNKFFGTTINAVFAIARQVEGQIYSISAAVIDTMKPQIMKSYGANDNDRMYRLSLTAGKFGFYMMSLIAIPLIFFMPEILKIWLNTVPDGTVLFTRILILACMSEQITRGIVYMAQATEKIKLIFAVVSIIRLSSLPISIVFLVMGYNYYYPIAIFLICEAFASLSRVFVASKTLGFNAKFFFVELFTRILLPFCISLFLCAGLALIAKSNLAIAVSTIASMIFGLIVIFLLGFNEYERNAVTVLIKSLINKYVYK